MVTVAVMTVVEVTDEELTVYCTPELSEIFRFMPLAKFVPFMDRVLVTDDATIPAGVIVLMVGVVLAAGLVLLPPPPQDASPNIIVDNPVSSPRLNK